MSGGALPNWSLKRWWPLPIFVVVLASVATVRLWRLESRAPGQLFETGRQAFAEGDLDTVVVAAEGLRDVAGFEPHVHLLDGMVRLRTGRLVEAIQEFGHAKDDPSLGGLAHTLSGEALYRLRKFRDAERILNLALERDPAQLDARRCLAALYCDLGAMTQRRRLGVPKPPTRSVALLRHRYLNTEYPLEDL